MTAVIARRLIGDGGLLRQVEARCRLRTARSQIVAALLITWVPLVLLGGIYERVTGKQAMLLHDAAVHIRVLVATPLLLFLDGVFPTVCTYVVERLVGDAFVRPSSRARFDRIVDMTRRHCERWLPELLLAVVAFVVSASHLFSTQDVTAADWWYALVALPLFKFMLYRALWRWALWVRFLISLSRVDLALEATHPDQRCGISFLRRPSLAYCALLIFATTAVVSAGWNDRFELSTWRSFLPFLLGFAVIATLLAFGPLLLFAPAIHRARVSAENTFGSLAVHNCRWFGDRWTSSTAGAALQSSDVQSLAAIVGVYRDTVKKTRVVLFEKKDVFWLLTATLVPVLPTMLMRITSDEWAAITSFVLSKGFP